ncbi:MAG: SgcJ/EcaC family oxidoreductase [Gemmatimonadales bacterium]
MRTRFFASLASLAVSALAACAAPPAATGTAEDEAAIRAMADKYVAAYGAKDAAALGALVTDDYEDVDPTGKRTQGRAGFEEAVRQMFATMPAGMTMSMTATTDYIRWIDANHAVAGGTWQTSPAMPPMPSKGSWMAAMVKQGTEWKMMNSLGAADMSAMMPADTTRK